MTKVGLIGEYPTDTDAMANLLSKKYQGIEWISLISNIHGSELENQRIKHLLRIAYQRKKPDLVLFIRDLDSHENDKEKIGQRKEWFADFKRVVDRNAILLLHIEEIESLLLADVSVLNKFYHAEMEDVEDCMLVNSPKEYIKERIKRYNQGDNRTLLKLYDYEVLLDKCRYFKKFDTELGAKLN